MQFGIGRSPSHSLRSRRQFLRQAALLAGSACCCRTPFGLMAEVRERGVTETALCPGSTRPDFFNVSGATAWLDRHSAQDVKPVVRAALKALEKRRPYVVSGWKNYVLSLLVRIATRATVVKESMKYFRLKM